MPLSAAPARFVMRLPHLPATRRGTLSGSRPVRPTLWRLVDGVLDTALPIKSNERPPSLANRYMKCIRRSLAEYLADRGAECRWDSKGCCSSHRGRNSRRFPSDGPDWHEFRHPSGADWKVAALREIMSPQTHRFPSPALAVPPNTAFDPARLNASDCNRPPRPECGDYAENTKSSAWT